MIFSRIARLFSTSPDRPPRIESAGRSHIGKVRRKNEDSLLLAPQSGLFIVCDGMGGHRGGEQASRLAVDTISRELAAGSELEEAVHAAHRALTEMARAGDQGGGSPGSTVVALQIADSAWQLAWVGDSRAWLLQNNRMQQLSVDHTVVQQMVNWGDITPEEALTHPDRNRLSQALGTQDKPPVVGRAEGRLQSGMTFLLATDGMALWNEPEKLQKLLASHAPEAAVERLIELSLAAGGQDNVSCIVVRCDG